MWLNVQDALVAYLQGQQAPGGRLESIQTVRAGDEDTTFDLQYPLVTVAAGDTFTVEGTSARIELRFDFDVAVHALDQGGRDSAERALQTLVWDGRGPAATGVLPALMALMHNGLTVDGGNHLVRVSGPPRLGFATQQSVWVAGLVIPVSVIRYEQPPR